MGNQTRDNLFCHTLISTSLTLSQSPVILSSSSSSLVSSLLLKDSISNLYILLMSALLLLKILSPNQIHQLAPMLLLLFALVSVKPRKLDLLSGSLSSSFFSSLPLCARTSTLLSPVSEGFSVRFPHSVSLSASSSLLPLLALNDFSPLTVSLFLSVSPLPLLWSLVYYSSVLFRFFSSSLYPHCTSSPPPAPELCPRSR